MDLLSPTNPLLWAFGAGLVLLGCFILWSRRRAHQRSVDLRPLLAVLRRRQPEFHQILAAVHQEQGSLRLAQHPEAGPALQALKETLLSAPAPGASALLQLGEEVELGPKTKGAMITILRALYFDSDLRPRLPQNVDQALDQALDRLTG